MKKYTRIHIILFKNLKWFSENTNQTPHYCKNVKFNCICKITCISQK